MVLGDRRSQVNPRPDRDFQHARVLGHGQVSPLTHLAPRGSACVTYCAAILMKG